MKIMLAAHGFPPKQIGGGELRAYRTARWLGLRGHKVQVIAIDDMSIPESELRAIREQWDGIDVTRISFNKSVVPGWKYQNPLISNYLTNRLYKDRPDVFHLVSGARMTGSALCAVRDMGVPAIVTLTEYYWLCPLNTLLRSTGDLCVRPDNPLECLPCFFHSKVNRRLRYWQINRATQGLYGKFLLWAWEHTPLLKMIRLAEDANNIRQWRTSLHNAIMRADRLIAPSHFLKDRYVASGIPERLFVVCRQGLDQSAWEPALSKKNNGTMRFGYIGMIWPHKGLDVLIRAFKRVDLPASRARLTIFGGLDNSSAYARSIKQMSSGDERIRFVGEFDNRQIPRIHSEVDVLVVPSMCYENSPNVILEAFACKTPVVASDHSGIAELVQRGVSGDLFPAGDDRSLAKILAYIVEHPSVLDQWRLGIPKVRHIEEEIDELERIYSSVIAGTSRSNNGRFDSGRCLKGGKHKAEHNYGLL